MSTIVDKLPINPTPHLPITTQFMEFLPSSINLPHSSKSRYLNKFASGETKLRILSAPVMGYQGWITVDDKKKCVRVEDGKQFPPEINSQIENRKYFWAFVIWNYTEDCLQVCITEKASVYNRLIHIASIVGWHDPSTYDIIVKRTGAGKEDTKYFVDQCLPAPLNPAIQAELNQTPIDLQQLFKSGDPFATDDMSDIAFVGAGYNKSIDPAMATDGVIGEKELIAAIQSTFDMPELKKLKDAYPELVGKPEVKKAFLAQAAQIKDLEAIDDLPF